jgi:hypothetical protein
MPSRASASTWPQLSSIWFKAVRDVAQRAFADARSRHQVAVGGVGHDRQHVHDAGVERLVLVLGLLAQRLRFAQRAADFTFEGGRRSRTGCNASRSTAPMPVKRPSFQPVV